MLLEGLQADFPQHRGLDWVTFLSQSLTRKESLESLEWRHHPWRHMGFMGEG